MPKVSIIMPAYNAEKYISESIDSVLCQTFRDFELIIVNDASTDNTCKIAKKYAQKDKRIKILENKQNLGVILSRNNAIKISQGKYIYTLDSDDIITPDCIEKLYKAITEKRGDIITCRVKYFSGRTEEMILPKPNKFNMAQQNCLVNAALFKKEDFEKSGGYDKFYNTGLEDYDLWLNLIFNQNKKIYKVPEILFFYRIKEIKQSRNMQNASQHVQIIETLYKKYPQMRFYKKLHHVIRKITRFLFRIQNNYIKIFKIPVWKIKKYDTVISVGAACFVPTVMKQLKLRDFSGPFDWMYGSDVITRLNVIKNRFENYFNFQDFESIGKNPDNGKCIYKNIRTGIVYNHDFPCGDLKDVFGVISEKYERRVKRTMEHLDKDKNVLLVYSELENTGNKQLIIRMMNDINSKYGAHIDLLYINNIPNMKLNTYSKMTRVSDYVIYAEYRYNRYPDELPYAENILKKLLKKAVK